MSTTTIEYTCMLSTGNAYIAHSRGAWRPVYTVACRNYARAEGPACMTRKEAERWIDAHATRTSDWRMVQELDLHMHQPCEVARQMERMRRIMAAAMPRSSASSAHT